MTPTTNNVEPTTLLHCPFCGGEAEMFQDGWHNAVTGEDEGVYWCIWCSQCGAAVRGYEEAETIATWNRRAE